VQRTLARRLAAEALGTTLLLATVIGSGVMGERLADGNVALALLANSVATGCVLAGLIATLGPISGAHFNPAVTIAFALQREFAAREISPYVLVQIVAAFLGVVIAHAMFGEALLSTSTHVRSGSAQWISEFVATFGLLSIIWAGTRQQLAATPYLIAAYITGAYWFTASTSFANPAVTLARAASDSFAGISPPDVPGFILAQFAGAFAATALWRWLAPRSAT
jgi:glycerol uptake facilitator-like aquaporin